MGDEEEDGLGADGEVREGEVVAEELLGLEEEADLVGEDAELVVELELEVGERGGGGDAEGDGLAGQHLDEDLEGTGRGGGGGGLGALAEGAGGLFGLLLGVLGRRRWCRCGFFEFFGQ